MDTVKPCGLHEQLRERIAFESRNDSASNNVKLSSAAAYYVFRTIEPK